MEITGAKVQEIGTDDGYYVMLEVSGPNGKVEVDLWVEEDANGKLIARANVAS